MDPSPLADGDDLDLGVSEAATEQVSRVAQLGWLAKGLLSVIIGFLGFALVDRDLGAKDADQGGALQVIAGAPAGRVLVLAMAVGLGLFSLWQLWSALVDDDDGLVGIVGRVAQVGIGLAYALLGYTALEAGIQDGPAESPNGNITPTRLSAWLFAQPGGRLAVILIGAGTFAAGLYQLGRIWTVDYAGDVRTDDLPSSARRLLLAGLYDMATFRRRKI